MADIRKQVAKDILSYYFHDNEDIARADRTAFEIHSLYLVWFKGMMEGMKELSDGEIKESYGFMSQPCSHPAVHKQISRATVQSCKEQMLQELEKSQNQKDNKMTRKMMICENPLPISTKLGLFCLHSCLHREGHDYIPDCLIPCRGDRVCKEVEEKPDWALVAQQQG